jgi:hypothetical protein
MKKYIINPNNFDGICLATVSPSDKLACPQSWDSYNAKHGNELILLTWEEFYTNWIKPYDANLQQPWTACSLEDYDSAIESASTPPIKHEIIGGYRTFFSSKRTIRCLHQVYAKKGNMCWTAIRSTDSSLLSLRAELLSLLQYITLHVEDFDSKNKKLKIRESAITLQVVPDENYDFRIDEKWGVYYSIVNHIPTICIANRLKRT